MGTDSKQFEEAKPGDTLHIETEMRPALFFY